MSRKLRLLIYILSSLILVGLLGGIYLWNAVYSKNTATNKKIIIQLSQGSEYDDALKQLQDESVLESDFSFKLIAQLTGIKKRFKKGRYAIKPGMSNIAMLRMFAAGKEEQVKLVLRSSWTLDKLLAHVSEELAADSMELVQIFNDSLKLKADGWSLETIPALFIPNTYFFYWNTSADEFYGRMLREYDAFWNEKRKAKAAKAGLSPLEVSILASIVEKETSKVDEMPTIAGVYLNRLRKNWKLEADPTVIYAVGNPDIRRVTIAMTETASPYNTYYTEGLPPGPICIPSMQAIEAVLKNKQHKFMFFCAKEDFSGYHNFTDNLSDHNLNSRRYQLELNKRGIR